jgi:hypothetical protein
MPTKRSLVQKPDDKKEFAASPVQLAYSPREVVKAAPISLSKFYMEVREGRLIARKIGGKTVVLREDLVAWLQSLPLKTAVSERHRDQANRRWAAPNNTANRVPR